jgi:GxxExxY protein
MEGKQETNRGWRMNDDRINALTETIIGAAFRVSNELGAGFIEKVYENSLAHDLRKLGIDVEQQHPIVVYYDETVVGEYFADLLVANTVVVEV